LGAKLEDARGTVMQAAGEIAHLAGVHDTRLSALYSSAPVDAGGPEYVHGVLRRETTLPPETLLHALLEIEQRHGRLRHYRNAPRGLDLGLHLYGDELRHTDSLTLSHPRMYVRAFVLMPLRERAPALTLAQGGLDALLAACHNQRLDRLALA